MGNIKPRSEKIIVWYKDIDGYSYLLTNKKNKELILNTINNKKFINIEGIIIKTDNIIKIEDYAPKDDVDMFISLQKKSVRDKIKEREKQKKQTVGRWFETVEEVKKRLEKKWIKYIEVN